MRFGSSDSTNTSQIDDRRGGGGKMIGGGLGIVGVLAVVAFKWFSGDRVGAVQTATEAARGAGGARQEAPAPGALEGTCEGVTSQTDDPKFIACVQNNVQTFWKGALGGKYQPAKLALFTDSTRSACGAAEGSTGPFYCPGDNEVYLDLGFFKDLQTKLKAKGGDFAEAYIVAHEYGHHVQFLLGTEQRIRGLQRGASKSDANALSVKMELQADCYAGVWGHSAFAGGKVDAREVGDAMDAAASVGDDRLQKAARGTVRPETFTHGSSADRMKWFKTGFDTGDYTKCNTTD